MKIDLLELQPEPETDRCKGIVVKCTQNRLVETARGWREVREVQIMKRLSCPGCGEGCRGLGGGLLEDMSDAINGDYHMYDFPTDMEEGKLYQADIQIEWDYNQYAGDSSMDAVHLNFEPYEPEEVE